MFLLDILSVTIGLTLIYIILSLITAILTEYIMIVLTFRSSTLYNGLKTLLGDKDDSGLTRQFYTHPLIKRLTKPSTLGSGRKRPPYIDPHTFSQVLLDLIVNSSRTDFSSFKPITNLQIISTALRDSTILKDSPQLQRQLQILLSGASTADEAYSAIDDWFEEMLSRIHEWYNRRIQLVLLIVAIFLAVLINADTIALINGLINEPTVRAVQINVSEPTVQQQVLEPETNPPPGTDSSIRISQINALREHINSSYQLVGWAMRPTEPDGDDEAAQAQFELDLDAYLNNPMRIPETRTEWFYKTIGLVLSALIVTWGARYWMHGLEKIYSESLPEAKRMEPSVFSSSFADNVKDFDASVEDNVAVEDHRDEWGGVG